MTDPSRADASATDEAVGGFILVELGNAQAIEMVDGAKRYLSLGAPSVSYLMIPQGLDPYGRALYPIPDEHDDALFPRELAEALAAVPDSAGKAVTRRLLVNGWLNDPSRANGLPNHEGLLAVIHPKGFWAAVAEPGSKPTWVKASHEGAEAFLADHFGCPRGYPDGLEDTHWTRYGVTTYPPGAAPPPDAVMLHTSWGRDIQAIQMGGFGYLGTIGTGTGTPTGTTFLGGSETGAAHTTNDCVGQVLTVGPNASGVGSTVSGLITGVTISGSFAGGTASATSPGYTVDQWYAASAPGGAAATTPNGTGFYQVLNSSKAAVFVGLSSDTTAVSLGGTGGTQDAASITQTLTSEVSSQPTGLLRKIVPVGHSAGASTWTLSPVFTIQGGDTGLPFTVAKAASSPSIKQGVGALAYMSLLSPSTALASPGDSLTLTWTFNMT